MQIKVSTGHFRSQGGAAALHKVGSDTGFHVLCNRGRERTGGRWWWETSITITNQGKCEGQEVSDGHRGGDRGR
jgi:hypothetical protein